MTSSSDVRDETVVIIGSGPAAAMAAAQLVERGRSVTMLDSGSRAPRGVIIRAAGNTVYRRMGYSLLSKDRLDSTTAPTVDWVSSLSNGGLSNFWTAAVPRFAPDDFTEGGRLDERYVWPVTYDDLAPYYDLVDQRLNVTAGDPILGVPSNVARHRWNPPDDWLEAIAAAQRSGEGLGAMPMAKGNPWMVAARGTEFSSFHCVIRPLLKRSNFTFTSGAHVTRVRWSPRESRVDGVEYLDRETSTTKTIPARAVVLAAGAIDSTMILLRSRSDDFPTGMGNTNGLVGRYLHDHPREWWPAQLDRPMRALSHPIYTARRDHADSDPLLAASHTIGLEQPVQRLKTYVRGRTDTIGVQTFGTMVPRPEVGVELVEHASDPTADRPRLDLSYDDATIANVIQSRDRFVEVMASGGVRARITGEFAPLRPGSSVHLGGTIRMHSNPQFGVLDEWNRIHDASNLVVCDLSCFTTGPEKNPTPTAMALAARAADRLARDLG